MWHVLCFVRYLLFCPAPVYFLNIRHLVQRNKCSFSSVSCYIVDSPSWFPSQHQEFSFLLKERVCPLVIKLFSPNIKFRQGSSSAASPAPVEKPYFPICMRLLRVVSVLIKHFYSLLVRDLSAVMASER